MKKEKKKKARGISVAQKMYYILQNRLFIPKTKEYLDKAGISESQDSLSDKIFKAALFLNFIASIFVVYRLYSFEREEFEFILVFGLKIILIALAFIMFSWLIMRFFLDYRVSFLKKRMLSINPKNLGRVKSRYDHLLVLKKKFEEISQKLNKKNISLFLFDIAILFNIILIIYLYHSSIPEMNILFIIVISLALWAFTFLLILLACWVLFFFWLDMRIYKRKVEIEEVLPDFLQLTSANISAGMPIDRALWYAVRPRFGVLAKEIEDVAKSTLVGERLDIALIRFSEKYDSMILQRSINLLLEGMASGGKVANLLNRIANNISETRIIRREMASSVTTYVIFIGFATLAAAPFLFALSTQLVEIMTHIMGNLDVDSSTMSSMGTMIGGTDAIDMGDYKIFAYTMITVTCFFSSIIISTIKNGNIKDGLNIIPVFILTGIIIYAVALKLMGMLLGGFFV